MRGGGSEGKFARNWKNYLIPNYLLDSSIASLDTSKIT
jgi:hypothetical protein